ncbi:TPA: transcriptional regulator [Staphylococcus aureus]
MKHHAYKKVNTLLDVESYVFFLGRELKQNFELSTKEFLIIAYLYYRKNEDVPLKEIIGDIFYKQSDVVKIVKFLNKKGFINKYRNSTDERCILISINEVQRTKIYSMLIELDKIVYNFNIERNYTKYNWLPRNNKEFFNLFMNIMHSKDSLKYKLNLTYLELSILYTISTRPSEILNLKDIFTDSRFMYPQIARAVNRLDNEGILIKERSIDDERLVLIKINEVQCSLINTIIVNTSMLVKRRKLFF